jgi:hypothetical protein
MLAVCEREAACERRLDLGMGGTRYLNFVGWQAERVNPRRTSKGTFMNCVPLLEMLAAVAA